MSRLRWPAHYSLESCREVEEVCFGLHPRIGQRSILQRIQEGPGILRLIARFLLHRPEGTNDVFFSRMAGCDVVLSPSLKTARGRPGASRRSRSDLVAAGTVSVDSGMSRWRLSCSGPSWAIGVIADSKWVELCEGGFIHDWPFVGGGYGHGVGLVNRRSTLFLAERTYGGQLADRTVHSALLESATEFGIVLDMSRARIFFEADGSEILGSSFECIDDRDRYRFLASLPDPDSRVTLIS